MKKENADREKKARVFATNYTNLHEFKNYGESAS